MIYAVSRSVVLTPRDIISACPGEEIVASCSESGTIATVQWRLRWKVFLQTTQVSKVEMTLSEQRNRTALQTHVDGLQLNFSSELISYSPLTAVFRTTAHTVLNGARVTCSTTSTGTSMDASTIEVTKTGNFNSPTKLQYNYRHLYANQINQRYNGLI